ncbi:MAG: OmpA family protein [Flavobacteriales bacterium]|nr:OmpA family protein [Flavobacteriales bacterium]
MKKYSILIVTFIFSIGIFAQEENCPEPNKKAIKLFNAAKTGTSRERRTLILEAIKKDPNYLEAYDELAHMSAKRADRAFNSGDVKGYQQNNNQKIKYWKKIFSICPDYRNFYHTMKLGDLYFGQRKFEASKKYFLTIMASPDAYKKDERYAYARVQDIETYIALVKDTVPFAPEKVRGPSTGYDEYLPMLSPDNRYLYFTRKMPDESKKAFDSGFKELFIKSRKGMDGYTGGIPMPAPFNLGQYQGGISISVNNKLLFITLVDVIPYRGKSRAGFGRMFDNADIFFSELKDGKWSKLESIGSNINTPTTWEAQPSISSDNKTLYFTRVTDVFGGDMDIYKSERQPDGSWGDPINLGAPINTPGDEKSPFMHSDSYTLYFSSNYHIGMGGYDIFYSKMNEKSKVFRKPINIGNPINTTKDEHGFIVSKNGDKAYYGSDEDGKDLNIYTFELYEEARPKSVAFVNGKMLNNLGEVPDGAQVILKNTATNQEVEAVIDQETGDYVAVITVDKDQDILLTAKKKGYAFSSQLISSNEIVVGKPIKTETVEIKPIEVGEAYRINDINFASNSYEITPRIMLVLNEFIDFLQTNDNLKIAINGYTDNVGDPKENLALSKNRAKAVYNYLLLEEIASTRLTFKGFGETTPLASNKTETGRRKNRRTEFVIVSK